MSTIIAFSLSTTGHLSFFFGYSLMKGGDKKVGGKISMVILLAREKLFISPVSLVRILSNV